MAIYNRDFLVPYLQSVCAVQMARKKVTELHTKIYFELNDAKAIKKNGGVKAPEKPKLYNAISGGKILVLIFGLLSYICAAIALLRSIFYDEKFSDGIITLFIIMLLFGLFLVGISVYYMVTESNDNKEMLATYERKLVAFEKKKKTNIANAQNSVVALEKQLSDCDEEGKRLDILLNKIYAANIVPSHYRNIYAAVYLYEYFSTSGANDLDHALSMFVLEEIKERLDIIIANQTESIINQEIMIANQYRSIELQSEYQSQMMSKLERIAVLDEERNRYLGMIEGNVAAITYFSATDYFR